MNPVIPRFFRRLLFLSILVLVAAYVVDFLFLRIRMNSNFAGNPLGSVTTYTATTTKSGKLEIFYERPQIEVCTKSLFPQLGHKPCWYLSHSPIEIISQWAEPETGPPEASQESLRSASMPKQANLRYNS